MGNSPNPLSIAMKTMKKLSKNDSDEPDHTKLAYGFIRRIESQLDHVIIPDSIFKLCYHFSTAETFDTNILCTISAMQNTSLFSFEQLHSQMNNKNPLIWTAKYQPTSTKYILLVRKKTKINAIDLQNASNYRSMLKTMDKHPFICSLQFVFETETKLFLAFDHFHPRTLLFTHLLETESFNSKIAMYYGAQLYLALQYLHDTCGFHLGDLNSDNLYLTKSNNLMLTDFEFDAQFDESSHNNSGVCHSISPSNVAYLCPEYITHGYVSSDIQDWWSFGVILYEMISGYPPFHSENENKMKENIISKRIEFIDNKRWPMNAVDLIEKLLNKDPEKRMNPQVIKSHSFFDSINFTILCSGQLKPPITNQYISMAHATNTPERKLQQTLERNLKNLDVGAYRDQTNCGLLFAGNNNKWEF